MNNTSTGSVRATKNMIPELRFPELANEREWDEKKLDKLGETISGLSGKSGDDFGKGKPFVTYKQVFDNAYIDFSKCGRVNISENENQNTLQKGDILFTTSSETPNEVGFASVLIDSPKEPTYLNSFCFSFRPFDLEKIKPDFSRYLFHSPIYRKSISALAQGSTRYNISKGAFLNLKLPIPKPKEQQKIASCLSSLDEVIAAHSQKLEFLKDHKKGMMQNLFPQERETIPKFRFPEFKNDGEWAEISLDNAVKFSSGGTPSKEKKEYWNGNIPWISASSMYYLVAEKSELNITETAIKEGASIAPKGSILILVRGSMLFRRIPICIAGRDLSFNQDVKSLDLKQNIDNIFFLYLLISKESKLLESVTSTGIGAGKLDTDGLKKMTLNVPSNKKEQQKIASCLSSLDALITAQAEKIGQLKLHKKGLMQGLFPNSITN